MDLYHGRAEPKSVIDYSFHLIISDPTENVIKNELPDVIEQGITSFKVYMTYDKLIVNDEQMLEIMAAAKKHGALTMIHAENNAMINWMSEKLIKGDHKEPKFHALSHPRTAESEAINRAVALSSFIDTPILIVHVSTEAGARIIAEARYDGHKVFGETCPQYICFSTPATWIYQRCRVLSFAVVRHYAIELLKKRFGVVCKMEHFRSILLTMLLIVLTKRENCMPEKNHHSPKLLMVFQE